jgi:hypothetical protein
MSCCDSNPNACGCCVTEPPLQEPQNRPGLPALAYRLGTYAVFFERLIGGISGAVLRAGPNQGARPLAALTTRALGDPSIALLDAWSTVADVLTFYQERIANEGYLRTATERLSILQLAREIGYELAPGVAATAYLAFTVEEIIGVTPLTGALSAPGPGNSPYNSGVVSIPQGSQVQSVPAPNGLPQTFETADDFEAHVEWNNLQPRLTRPADLAMYLGSFYLLASGASFLSNTPGLFTLPTSKVYPLNPATALPSSPTVQAVLMQELFLQGISSNLKYGDRLLLVGENQGQLETQIYTVVAVKTDPTLNQTRVAFAQNPVLPPFQPNPVPSFPLPSGTVPFTAANVKTYILQNTVRESDLQAFLKTSGWQAGELMAQVNNPPLPSNAEYGVFAMRSVPAFFGNNAPPWKSLTNPGTALRADPYPINWDAPNRGKGRGIWTDSQGNAHSDADVLLERSFPQVLPNSWAYFTSPQYSGAFRITDAADQSVADYGLSTKVTGLTLDLPPEDRPLLLGSPSLVKQDANRMDAFAIGSDGNLYHWVWDGAWHARENLGGGNLINAPSAVSWGAGRVDAFAVNEDGNLFHWPNEPGASGLQNLGGGYLTNSPSAVSWGAGRIDVFAVGFDGSLYHFWNTTLSSTQHWSGPEYRGGTNLVGPPKAISQAPDTLEIFTNGSDGHAYSHQWANHKWTGPDEIGEKNQLQKFVNSPARGSDIQIYNIATDGKLYLFLYQHSQFWTPWYGQNLTGSPCAVTTPVSPSVFGVGANGDLQQVIEGVGQRDLGGNASLIGSPSALTRGGDLIDILVSNDSGHILHFSFDGKVWAPPADLGGPSIPQFLVRKTTAYVQSELQPLAGLPLMDDVPAGAGSLMLNTFTVGLTPGRRVALSGIRADAPGVVANEILTLQDVVHTGGLTILEFTAGLAYSYQRDSVSINANVVKATHGATVKEVLGNGDASQSNQSFSLKRPPLTYVSATTPGGVASTLQIQVNNLNWTEAASFYGSGPKDEEYIVRLADDGTPTITFGDPAARLQTGQQNVRATYRTGIGSAGDVDAGSLSILMTRPPGTRGVVNPLPASGGADPQNLADARVNAPLTVLTLDRIVSLNDYENFCRAFAGVGKAQAIEIWSGQSRAVHVTIATSDGASVDASLPLTERSSLRSKMLTTRYSISPSEAFSHWSST